MLCDDEKSHIVFVEIRVIEDSVTTILVFDFYLVRQVNRFQVEMSLTVCLYSNPM